jgi:hypothetical protein
MTSTYAAWRSRLSTTGSSTPDSAHHLRNRASPGIHCHLITAWREHSSQRHAHRHPLHFLRIHRCNAGLWRHPDSAAGSHSRVSPPRRRRWALQHRHTRSPNSSAFSMEPGSRSKVARASGAHSSRTGARQSPIRGKRHDDKCHGAGKHRRTCLGRHSSGFQKHFRYFLFYWESLPTQTEFAADCLFRVTLLMDFYDPMVASQAPLAALFLAARRAWLSQWWRWEVPRSSGIGTSSKACAWALSFICWTSCSGLLRSRLLT